MKSLATIIEEVDFGKLNKEQFDSVLRRLNPELYLIHLSLVETGVNPSIVPRIIKAICNLSYGSGYGKIRIHMEARVISQIEGIETDEINEKASVEK